MQVRSGEICRLNHPQSHPRSWETSLSFNAQRPHAGCAGVLKQKLLFCPTACFCLEHGEMWLLLYEVPWVPNSGDNKNIIWTLWRPEKSQLQSQPTSLLPGIRFNAQYCQPEVGTCQEPLSTTKQQQHLPSASGETETCAATAAELLVRGTQDGEWGPLCSRETSGTGLQMDIFRNWFHDP